MVYKKVLYIFIARILLSASLNLDYLDPLKLQTKTSPQTQEETALRVIKKYLDRVTVNIDTAFFKDHKDAFSLLTEDNKLVITASTGVAAVWGFNHYLKKYCKGHIGWQVKRVSIPNPLPFVNETVESNDRFRYYQNTCTVSYSFVWWNVSEWLDHVEWMALNGINLALAPVAQEAVWLKVYRKVGLTDEEIQAHFTGPAFLSWLRMGNIRNFSGPLLQSWHDRQIRIQDAVIKMFFDLGMVPILPSFSGFVPRGLKRIYPEAYFHNVNPWCHLTDTFCCPLFIDGADPLFKTIGKMFLNEITAETTGHIYTADSFNENRIQPWNTEVVVKTAKAMFSTMTELDDQAVWLLQNWIFVNDAPGWPKERAEAYLRSVPLGRLLVLDLQSERRPQYLDKDMYFGQPFIWCFLHNFGGTMGMYGATKPLTTDVYNARVLPNSTMVGIGLTPEGINQNYVLYELMLESAWRPGSLENIEAWGAEYAERRYGCNQVRNAWTHLLNSVYNCPPSQYDMLDDKGIVINQPGFDCPVSHWYKGDDVFKAWKIFTSVQNNECDSPGFSHDLVDVTRQALHYIADQLYGKIKQAMQKSDVKELNATSIKFVEVLRDMRDILATNDDFTVQSWIQQARNLSSDPAEKDLYEENARNQISIWGPNGSGPNFNTNYAGKQYAEMLQYLYIPRWEYFLNAALEAKVKNVAWDESATKKHVYKLFDIGFQNVSIPLKPLSKQNSRLLAKKLYDKWKNVTNC